MVSNLLRRVLASHVLLPIVAFAYPILSLLAFNSEYVAPAEAIRGLAVCLASAIILYALVLLWVRSAAVAALTSSLVGILALSYGHMYDQIKNASLLGLLIGRHRFLAPAVLAALLLMLWWIARRLADPDRVARAMTLVAFVLVAFPVFQLSANAVRKLSAEPNPALQTDLMEHLAPSSDRTPPDIYYIILDGYARDDVLRVNYDFDNSYFLQGLEGMGFEVASGSRSNYALTLLSLASSLNMDYLQSLDPNLLRSDNPSFRTRALIRESSVISALRHLGYTFVALESAVSFTNFRKADLYIPASPLGLSSIRGTSSISAFEALFIRSTMARLIIDGTIASRSVLNNALEDPYRTHRARVLNIFESLPSVAEMEGPKFVFAHVMAPHPPYIFGPDGEPIYSDETFTLTYDLARGEGEDFIIGYRNQVQFVNSQVLETLPEVLARSDEPPIIIIQGDHGGFNVSPSDRMLILNAYLLPGGGGDELYEKISPVNSFRVIFNEYFGGDLPLLQDRGYYSNGRDRFDISQIYP